MNMENDGRNDFDFLLGSWKVHHRVLAQRLKGSTDWRQFEGDTVNRKILNELGILDESTIYWNTGPIRAMALRLFNPTSREWSIYWSTDATGILDVPVIGCFKEDGHGEFYSQEVFEGRHIYSRFLWSKITSSSCQWEQAFSEDGGQTWETNWVMEFERT